MSQPLSEEDMRNPTSNIVLLIIYIFSLETPIYSLLNKACRDGDITKKDSLGPLSCALFMILSRAQERRLDHLGNPMPHKFNLFRGVALSQDQIDLHVINKRITLFGFTSTSLIREQATKLALSQSSISSNFSQTFLPVVYMIKWNSSKFHFVMDFSAYAYEKEVLLMDGQEFMVSSIENVENQ